MTESKVPEGWTRLPPMHYQTTWEDGFLVTRQIGGPAVSRFPCPEKPDWSKFAPRNWRLIPAEAVITYSPNIVDDRHCDWFGYFDPEELKAWEEAMKRQAEKPNDDQQTVIWGREFTPDEVAYLVDALKRQIQTTEEPSE